MKEGNAVFVKLNEYREILDVLELIKGKISDAKDTIKTRKMQRSRSGFKLSQIWRARQLI